MVSYELCSVIQVRKSHKVESVDPEVRFSGKNVSFSIKVTFSADCRFPQHYKQFICMMTENTH